ncbi:MAG TPA: TetR/AcrR family transcriptional regulator [Iamia sp.]|nr:TetR/AcrR family transcriptional regulator [Iamia sp.]
MVVDRKAEILAAAAELFAAQGFSGTSVDQIGASVGLTGPALYRHYRGKDALLAAVVMDTVAAFAVSEAASADGVEAVVAEAVAVALDGPAPLATYVRERHRLVGEEREALARAERRLYRPWRAVIRAANPALAEDAVAPRQLAALTAMSEVASQPQSVARPALERLLIGSMVAVLGAPPIPAAPAPDPSGWTLPPSRRDRIRAEALRLFRQRGYHGVGMDEIGRAVGVSGPTIYSHHASKAAILLDASERAEARLEAAAHHAVARAASASDALDRLAAASLRVAADDGDLVVVTSREAAALDALDARRLARRRDEVLATWSAVVGALRPDLPEGAVRAVVSGVLPLVGQVGYGLHDADVGAPLVRAWCLGELTIV